MASPAGRAAPLASTRRLPVALLVTVAALAQLIVIRLADDAISPLLLCGLAVASVLCINVAVSWWDGRAQHAAHPR